MSMGMIYPGGEKIEDLPKVKECIQIAKSESEAISTAFKENTPVAFLDIETGTGGISGLFSNTLGARAARGEVPATWERMDELREAAEPLRKYLMKYGDGHTCVTVTPYGATETRDERRVLFQDERQREREAQFERELQALTGNG